MPDKEEKPEKVPEPLVPVNIITRGEKMALVEFTHNGTLKRVSIPLKELKEEQAPLNALEKGVPYGLPFETLDFPDISAQDIGNVLHTHGLWTADDLRTKPKETTSALMSIVGKYYAVLLTYIQNK